MCVYESIELATNNVDCAYKRRMCYRRHLTAKQLSIKQINNNSFSNGIWSTFLIIFKLEYIIRLGNGVQKVDAYQAMCCKMP